MLRISRTSLALSGLVVAAATGGILLLSQARTNRHLAARLNQLQRENADARARLDDSTRRIAELSRRLEQAHAPETEAPAVDHANNRALQALRAQDAQTIERLKAELAQANSSITRLENRILDLEAQVQSVSVENKRLAASEADLSQNLAGANRVIEAMRQELKSKNDRLVQLEVFNKKLREQSASDGQRRTEQIAALRDLQEIQRRRDSHLTSILRRYRDITDQYRALTGVLEDRRQSDTPPAVGFDLSRIQNSIAMAEEDLRQINSLNAQESRLQRQLTRP